MRYRKRCSGSEMTNLPSQNYTEGKEHLISRIQPDVSQKAASRTSSRDKLEIQSTMKILLATTTCQLPTSSIQHPTASDLAICRRSTTSHQPTSISILISEIQLSAAVRLPVSNLPASSLPAFSLPAASDPAVCRGRLLTSRQHPTVSDTAVHCHPCFTRWQLPAR